MMHIYLNKSLSISQCMYVCMYVWSMICESSLNFRKMLHGKSVLRWQSWIHHLSPANGNASRDNVVAAAQGACPTDFCSMGISLEQNKEVGHKYQRTRETKCRGAQMQEILGGDGIRKACVQSQVSHKEWNCWSKEQGSSTCLGDKPWASGNGEEIKSDRLCCPCTVFLALSDQMMDGDGWWSNPLLDEGSCTSRVTPWGLLGKCQWKGGCFGGTRHSLGLLDQMSSPIQGVAFGICALDRGWALWVSKMAKCPSHGVDHWMLKCRSPARMVLASQNMPAEMLWSHNWWRRDVRSTEAWHRSPAVEMEDVNFPSPLDVRVSSASEGCYGHRISLTQIFSEADAQHQGKCAMSWPSAQ